MLNPAPFILAGLVNGSVYGLAAMGLVFTYKVSRVVNYAYGAIAMFCSYSYWQVRVEWGVPAPLAFIVAVVLLPSLLAVLSERFVYRRLAEASVFATTAASVGILLAAYGGCLYFWNERIILGQLRPPSIFPDVVYHLPGVFVNGTQIGVIASTLVTVLVVFVFLRFTATGLALRAVVANRGLSELRGIDSLHVTRVSWILSYIIAAFAGVLLATLVGSDPLTLTIIVVYSLTAATLGGFLSLPLAVIGGVLLGLTDSLLIGYLPAGQFWQRARLTFPFAFLLMALIIIGRRVASRPEPGHRAALLADLGQGVAARKASIMGVLPRAALVIVAGFLLKATGNGYAVVVLSTGAAYGVIFLGSRVFSATTGMVSLALAAFAGVGAMTAADLRGSGGWPWLLAVIGGGVVAAGFGAIVAIPTVRLRGIFLALGTIAFAQLIEKVVFTNQWFSGGMSGRPLPRPSLVRTDMAYLVLLVVIFVVIGYLCELFQHSVVGRELQADLGSGVGARSIGIRQEKGRLLAFLVSSGVIGVGGALLATQAQQVSPESFGFILTFLWLVLVASGGLGSTIMMLQMGVLSGATLEIVSVHFPRFERGYVALFGVLGLMLLRIPGGAAALEARMAHRIARLVGRSKNNELDDHNRPSPVLVPSAADEPSLT